MKAIVFDRAGEPDQVLRLDDVSEPEPRAGEQLVRLTARPIHPADLSFIRGQYRIRPSLPQVAGLEGIGVVLGRGRTGPFAPGTRVAFRWPGSWAEVSAVPEHRLITVPAVIRSQSPGSTSASSRRLATRPPGALPSVIAGLWALIRQGALSLPIDSTFALSAFREALAADGRRGRQGKVLLT